MPTWIGVFSGVSTFFRTTTGKDKFGLSNNVDDKDSHRLEPTARRWAFDDSRSKADGEAAGTI
jgi:hypothetical protein